MPRVQASGRLLRLGSRDKILVLDGSSFIGGHLFRELGNARAVATYYRSPVANTSYFDATSMDLSEVVHSPTEFSHAVVLMAIPNPDDCAADVNKSYAVNVTGVKRVIDYLNRWEIKPVFTSTESVFDGTKGNYVETDSVGPVLTYGRQKVEIEKYIQNYCPRFTIARLAKVIGSKQGDGTLFTSWFDDIERSRVIYCAQDQIFSPIHVRDVANAIIRLIDLDRDGIFHVCNTQTFSRLEFFNIFLNQMRESSNFSNVEANVVPCSIHDFDVLEKRPMNVSMNPNKLLQSTGFQAVAVEDVIQEILHDPIRRKPGNRS